MSALETTVRVSPEKQTLILAGEAVPQRGLANPRSGFALFDPNAGRPLTLVATPVEEPLLLMGNAVQSASYSLVTLSRSTVPSRNPAAAYARTQALSSRHARAPIVDTYA
jgi:hypothetical protein